MVSQWLAPVVLTIESVILLALAIYLLYLYGDIKRQNKFVTALTLCIWFLSFFTVFLLPIDVSSVSASCPVRVLLYLYLLHPLPQLSPCEPCSLYYACTARMDMCSVSMVYVVRVSCSGGTVSPTAFCLASFRLSITTVLGPKQSQTQTTAVLPQSS